MLVRIGARQDRLTEDVLEKVEPSDLFNGNSSSSGIAALWADQHARSAQKAAGLSFASSRRTRPPPGRTLPAS